MTPSECFQLQVDDSVHRVFVLFLFIQRAKEAFLWTGLVIIGKYDYNIQQNNTRFVTRA